MSKWTIEGKLQYGLLDKEMESKFKAKWKLKNLKIFGFGRGDTLCGVILFHRSKKWTAILYISATEETLMFVYRLVKNAEELYDMLKKQRNEVV